MSERVNPPPHIKTPGDFFADKEKRSYFQQIEFMLFQLWKRTGGGTDAVADAGQHNRSSNADIIAINQRLGSGHALTSDETGFTVDLISLTVDMDEASI